MKDCFLEFKNYPNIEINAKLIGSIMHYLVIDTFNNNPSMLKDHFALMNYYRNYHIYNEDIESQDIFGSIEFEVIDEYEEYLVPRNTITEFWSLNTTFVETFKNYVYSWATRLARLIRLKYEKNDVNLFPRRGLKKPRDKTCNAGWVQREEEEEEEEVEEEEEEEEEEV
jgi:hypothetical protein